MTRFWRRCGFQLAIPFGIASLHASSDARWLRDRLLWGLRKAPRSHPMALYPIIPSSRAKATKRVISGGTQAGSNLSHSFEQFSVPPGGTAYFNNALDIQNIISRVTGGSISSKTLPNNKTRDGIPRNGIMLGKTRIPGAPTSD